MSSQDDRVGYYVAHTSSEGAQRTLDERLKGLTVRIRDRQLGVPMSDPADRGKFRYAVTANAAAQLVRIDFGGPVTAVGLTADEVEALVQDILSAVWELRGIKPT